jgi:hypothetical protein
VCRRRYAMTTFLGPEAISGLFFLCAQHGCTLVEAIDIPQSRNHLAHDEYVPKVFS